MTGSYGMSNTKKEGDFVKLHLAMLMTVSEPWHVRPACMLQPDKANAACTLQLQHKYAPP